MMATLAVSLPAFMFIESKEEKTGLVVGLIYFFIYMIAAFTSSQSGKLAAKIQKKAFLASATLFLGLSFGALSGLFYDFLLLIPAIVAFLFVYIFENLRKPILTGYVVDEVPEEILTSVLSVQSFLKTIFAAVIAFFLGLFSDLFGVGLGLVFLSTGLILVVIFLEVMAYVKTNHSTPD